MKYLVKTWADKLIQAWVNQPLVTISHHTIAVANLPEAFQGFRIAQISDLHIDRWNSPIVEAAINQVNALKADLLVCTGDMIAEGTEFLGDVAYLLKQFEARLGKLACLGNHDYSDGHGSHGVRHALGRAQFDVLVNESTQLTVGHQTINLAGADDLILGSQCLQTTTRRLDSERPTLLLSHNPHNFPAMAHFKPDLILSGHTHGGQIPMPAFMREHFFGSSYVAGHYRHRTSQLYVNRGLGAAVIVHHMGGLRFSIPTPRWHIHPEVSVFTLVPARKQDIIPASPLQALAS